MRQEFQYDVFLSHSAEAKAAVRPLTERLRQHWLLTDSQPSTLNPQPLHGWAQLQVDTFRFRAPLNHERRSIPQLAEPSAPPS